MLKKIDLNVKLKFMGHFRYQRTIWMQDTDATGVLYFANQLQIALEAFETYLQSHQFSIKDMIAKGDFLLPIVHTEADYFSPVFIGDQVDIELRVKSVGTTSLTLNFELYKEKEKVGTVLITHVVMSRQTKEAIPIPSALIKIISSIK